MSEITLRGILGKKFGEKWLLKVESIAEIFEAIEANTLKVSSVFRNFQKFCTHFIVFVDGKLLPMHLIRSKVLNSGSKVDIVPVIQGGWVVAIIAIVLIVLSIVLLKLLSPKLPKDVQTSSSVLGGIRNVLNQNIVVPVGYGRLRVGSAVISNNTTIKNENSEDSPSMATAQEEEFQLVNVFGDFYQILAD